MQYEVTALSKQQGIVSLLLDAAGEEDAVGQAKQRGFSVVSVRSRRVRLTWKPRFQLVLFVQELLALLDAGLTIVEAIETLGEKEHAEETRRRMERVVAALHQGQSLSQALGQFPASFPPLFIATVRASEKTGSLSESLARFVAYQTQLDAVRKKAVSASLYPLVLIVAGGLVCLFLLGYVVPKFSNIYQEMGRELPFLSRMLLLWGRFLGAHGAAVGLVVAAAIGGFAYVFARPNVRARIAAHLWRLPVVGERLRVYELARFYRTLGMLLRGGIPLIMALDMVSGLLPPALRRQLRSASESLSEGHSISESMHGFGLTTPIALRMLRVGERTGRMGEMMERIAGFYDEEMARSVDWFTRLFEPLLMALIGIVIGGIVVLMYLPIFELAGSIQ